MPMLRLQDEDFSAGRAKFRDSLPNENRSARIYVKVAVEGMVEPFLALLDTGAEYSVLAREIAQAVGLTEADGEIIQMGHRLGSTPGKLVRANLELVADEGSSLVIDSIVFIPEDGWPANRNFIGYTGFLELVRIGLDPQQNNIYFGGYQG